MTIIRTMIFAGVILCLTPIVPASACSCIVTPVNAARAQATAVFEGEVLQIIPPSTSGSRALVVMRVIRVWKGAVGPEVRLLAFTPSMCPPHFEVGSTMILYAEGELSQLHIRQCARWGVNLRTERRELGRPIRRL